MDNNEIEALAASYQQDYIKADADRRILQHRLQKAEERIKELEESNATVEEEAATAEDSTED